MEAANSWIYAQGRVDSRLSGMSCAFSSMILSRRTCHIVHIGDTRAYRMSEGRLERLTKDHVAGRGDLAQLLNRAIGFEDFARVDYTAVGLRQHDRLLICSDGVHGVLNDDRLQVLLDERASPEETARTLVDAALAAGSSDNTTLRQPVSLSRYRPDLPAWLDAIIGKALTVDPTQRFGDVIEFAHELENGAMWAKPAVAKRQALYERNPLVFWKVLSASLIILVAILLARR
jgi:hypothetical protein